MAGGGIETIAGTGIGWAQWGDFAEVSCQKCLQRHVSALSALRHCDLCSCVDESLHVNIFTVGISYILSILGTPYDD